jgi:hypothetical protein
MLRPMRTIFKISVLSNVLLLGGMVLLWRCSRVATVPAPVTPVMVATVEPQTTPAPVVEMAPTAFRWSHLTCTNGYRAFVANLRAAGCPEATVEDIVRGNAGRAYAMMRQKLGVNETQPGPWSAQAQAKMVAYFLGQSPTALEAQSVAEASAAPAANNQATDNQTTDNAEGGTAALAEFLQNVDFTTPGMSAEQAQESENSRQTLLAQLSAGAVSQPQNNNQGNSSSTGGSDTTSSQTSTENSQTGTDNLQVGSDNSQTSSNGTGNKTHEPPQGSPAIVQAENAESMLGGVFGIGAAMQYDQYQSSQGGQL